MRKSYSIEELNLDQWVLGINVEIDVDHDVENYDQAKDDDIWADALHLSDNIDRC